MRVLVGCEFSGKVRDAFRALGHDAVSVDLLPTEAPGPHIQGDVRKVLDDGWDLGIFFPPCTYLTKSGIRWLHTEQGRWEQMLLGASFFRELLEARIPRVAVENPIPHRYATQVIGCRQTQVIQPWMFGHREQKATALWLRGLAKLEPTDDVRDETMALPPSERQKILWAPDSAGQAHARSITYDGIAEAMAAQWG